MECLRIYKCGNIYKYISIPFIDKKDVYNENEYTKTITNLCKLENNIIRAKTKIKDLILCNDFLYFITITFNSDVNRYDLETLQKKVCQRIRDSRKTLLCNLHYILIPETHKNGAWHFHGVLSRDFQYFIYYNKYNYLSCKIFDDLGFVSISTIQDKTRVASYITKYITKDMAKREKGKHLYFTSNKLNKPRLVNEIIYNSTYFDYMFFDYFNDFCAIRYDNELKNLSFLKK